MPIYEYKCNSCGKKFEKIERFSDSPLETHEECGGPVERLLSAPAFQFKGTGWYVTDYARSNGSGAGKNGQESGKDSNSEGKSEAKSDSKSSDTSTKSSESSKSSDSSSSTTATTTSTADKK